LWHHRCYTRRPPPGGEASRETEASAHRLPRLREAFDRVPREDIWYALRHHGVPEELIEWVRIL
uniref:DUF2384 domain-containing protein n=1 Tax=Heligmosomoides polygyrus TaxID=6339 RepID=A0A183GXM4_HELPZ